MAKSDSVVIPFPSFASRSPVDRPVPDISPAPPSVAEQEDASRALLNELILHVCRTEVQRRNGHD